MAWISENAGTIGVVLVLVFIVFLIIRKLVKDKKAGRTSCGSNCGACAMHGSCHANFDKFIKENTK